MGEGGVGFSQGGSSDGILNPATRWLSVPIIERLLVGDVRVAGMILGSIADRCGTAPLRHQLPQVAKAISKCPPDYIRAAKNYCKSEWPF